MMVSPGRLRTQSRFVLQASTSFLLSAALAPEAHFLRRGSTPSIMVSDQAALRRPNRLRCLPCLLQSLFAPAHKFPRQTPLPSRRNMYLSLSRSPRRPRPAIATLLATSLLHQTQTTSSSHRIHRRQPRLGRTPLLPNCLRLVRHSRARKSSHFTISPRPVRRRGVRYQMFHRTSREAPVHHGA